MGNEKWETTKQAGVKCGVCGKSGTCNVSPDRTAFKCWKDGAGGKVHQIGGGAGGGGESGTGYVGKAHRKPSPAFPPLPPSLPTAPPKPKAGGKAFATAADAIEAAGRGIDGGELAAVWTYTDAAGAEVMRVARFNLPDGDKQFRPVCKGKGGWKIGDPSGLLPLYHLPELFGAGPAYVCEGEKATDAARALGLTATTSAHGSSSAAKTDWTPLAGRDVAILPDNDEPGRKYRREVSAILLRLDPPARVRVVNLPGLPEGGDVVEYVAAAGDTNPDAIRDRIEEMAIFAPQVQAADVIGGPVLTCLADVEAREIEWLWKGRVALGRLTLLVGKPGEGKSYATCDMAARVTTGTPWPDGAECARGSVILVCAEDDPADTIRPRLDAHGADVKRVHLLSAVRRFGEDGKPQEVMFTLADVLALEAALKATPDCRLIVIDPIGSFLGGGTDAHRDNEVRAVLAPVAMLAEKHRAAVVIVAHRRKGTSGSADESALGSRAFTGIARAVWHISRDPANPARRLFLPGKNNLAPEGHGLAFSIVGQPVGAVSWEREPVTMNADDAMAAEGDREKPGPEPKAKEGAAEWLRGLLSNGAVETKQIQAEAKAAGVAWGTLRRAADAIGVKRERCEFTNAWQWRLPKLLTGGDTPPNENNLSNLSNLGFSRENRLVLGPDEGSCSNDEPLSKSAGGGDENGGGR